jgi:hypothetical protein
MTAVISVGISAVAFVISLLAYVLARQKAVADRRPVLVFEWTEKGWRLENPGNGPALNIQVQVRGRQTAWTKSVVVSALASSADCDLPWIGTLNAWMLGAQYEDFSGYKYTTIAQHDRNLLKRGNCINQFTEKDKDYVEGRYSSRVWSAHDISNDQTLM